jgi:TDG/mug DNA glycosylase family protein
LSDPIDDLTTLPDLLRPGLEVVFVGINPSSYSVARGHYFARKQSRFWPAFSRSRLSAPVRAALGRDRLGPEDDVGLLEHGFGFTDVVKVPSANASTLRPADYAEWAPRLIERLGPIEPRVVCFHGAMAFGAFRRYGLGQPRAPVALGAQSLRVGAAAVFVVPNPSPANARFTPADQAAWYDRLADRLG